MRMSITLPIAAALAAAIGVFSLAPAQAKGKRQKAKVLSIAAMIASTLVWEIAINIPTANLREAA